MRYISQHITAITGTFKGDMPLAHFLKGYFRRHPILGSRDRRILTTMAYSYYRVVKGTGHNAIISYLTGPWLDEKLWQNNPIALWADNTKRAIPFNANELFPYDIVLSEGITKDEWLMSMLVQPNLFIRIRKNKDRILQLLRDAGIPCTPISDTCLSLPNGAKIDALLPANDYVVQDASSQRTGSYLNPAKNQRWYDCCSGAGGKSLLLKDLEPGVSLTVSDKRDSIIHNLKQRFKLYGHKVPESYIIDVSDEQQLNAVSGNGMYDNIICDAPCSGSGTWARTPEQMYFFDPATLSMFSSLQYKIAANAAKLLLPGGRLIYITCSVFQQENDAVVQQIINSTDLEPLQKELINGADIRADSMYVAVLRKRT